MDPSLISALLSTEFLVSLWICLSDGRAVRVARVWSELVASPYNRIIVPLTQIQATRVIPQVPRE